MLGRDDRTIDENPVHKPQKSSTREKEKHQRNENHIRSFQEREGEREGQKRETETENVIRRGWLRGLGEII